MLTDRSGAQLLNTLVPFGGPLPSQGNTPQGTKVLETGRPVVSDLFIEPVARKEMIAIEVPVFRGNEIKYTLSAGFLTGRFNELLKQQGLQSTWITSIFDASGGFVVRTLNPADFVGQKGSPLVMGAIARATSGVIENKTREGVPVFAAFSRSEATNWAVVIRIPIAELAGDLRTSLLLGGAGAFILLSSGFLLAGYQSTRIARSVQALLAPAVALGRGEVPCIPRLPVREVDEVAQALERASLVLQARTVERDQADVARRASESKLNVLVDHALDGLIAMDEKGTVEHFNPACERIFGYEASEVIGQNIGMLMPELFRAERDSHLSNYLGTGNAQIIGITGREVFAKRKDGSVFPVDLSIGAFQSKDRRHFSGIIRDITARKEAEAELRRYTSALERRNSEMEEFAYVASHDLKAPLRVIDNASKWLEEDLAEHLTGENRENMELLRGRVGRMEKLLDDLLEYSRVGRKTDGRYAEVMTGDKLMADILALLAPPEGFTVKVSPVFAGIHIRRMPLQQILTNLIGNAVKHHHKKVGCIEVTVEDCGYYYVFSVKDDGPGIPAQFHEQVFKIFQTLKPRDQVEGSGMGLAMARKLIDAYGGTLALESADGQGSVFRFTWPKQQQVKREAA